MATVVSPYSNQKIRGDPRVAGYFGIFNATVTTSTVVETLFCPTFDKVDSLLETIGVFVTVV